MPNTGAIPVASLLDLTATTLAKVPANEYRNLLIGQSYVAQQFLSDLKPRPMGGRKVAFNAIIMGDTKDTGTPGDGGPGRYGPYGVLGSEAANYQAQGEAPWSFYNGYWILSSQDIRLNQGKEGFIDNSKSTLEGGMTRMVNVIENDFWSRSGYLYEAAAEPMILGPEYWITDDGYHVADPAGTLKLAVAGINPTDARFNDAAGRNRWRNQFVNETNAAKILDALDALFIDCQFKAPPTVALNTTPEFKRFKIVMDKTTKKTLMAIKRRLKEGYDNELGTGEPTFNNVKMEFADKMAARSDSKGQVFFENMATWKSYVESGNNWRRDPVITPSNQDARMQRFFFWPALVCEDRRSNGKAFGWGALALK
jgi:hypothetical protein